VPPFNHHRLLGKPAGTQRDDTGHHTDLQNSVAEARTVINSADRTMSGSRRQSTSIRGSNSGTCHKDGSSTRRRARGGHTDINIITAGRNISNDTTSTTKEGKFVNNELHTTSTGQIAHQDSVKKSCLWRILFHKICLQRIFFHQKNLASGAFCLDLT